ncbi:MAG TPA: UDP-N-acetylmuramoyl-L-alanine--D-glutamate ligase [Candidatus Acidoferrum sp.]|jgi:UDP-N-acetylmuramoylalanine--D-glutamate ligase
MELKNKRVLVVGLARTGVATALFCAARGARVTATESRDEAAIGESVAKLRAAGVALELGGHVDRTFVEQDLIVPSPGVPADFPQLVAARKSGVKIWSEIELAYRFLQGSLVGITGSNGKTTTTALIEHILRGAGLPTMLAGNIGTPLISVVDQAKKNTVTVVELSSFQLELIDSFRPNVGLFLNLTPDHLDRHHTLKAYAAAKARIFENQTADDAAIINADDAGAAAYAPSKPQLYWFSRKQRVAQGAYLRGEEVVLRIDGEDHTVLRRGEIPLAGAHNLENVLAATIATKLAGAALPAIAAGVRSFAGVEHRLEFVAEINGVRYYNDSKATNVDATLKALDAFPGRILIILGGKDKGSDYTVLQQPLREKAILALLIGAAAEKIDSEIAGSVPIERAGTLERAVETAARTARRGDVVLLAPACASFDQFENYEQRGRVFKDLVRGLQSNATSESAKSSATSSSTPR